MKLHDVHPPLCDAIPTVVLPRDPHRDELGYLQCFLNPALIDTFVTQTNQYAIDRRASAWLPVTTEEMWRYLAVRIRQGIVRLPELHHYWEATYRDTYISQLMTRDRFVQLHRCFHISSPVPCGRRQTVVEKTAPFYHKCQDLFQQYFVPGRKFAVDETMVRFQERSSWIAIIKGKPSPMGYKLYTVASQGYLLGFRIFRGKGGYDTSVSVLHHTVIDLVRPWAYANRHLYFDKLYTSPALCDHLLGMAIRSCGTCRSNRRGLPANMREIRVSLPKGEMRCWQRGQLGCLMWNDKRPVPFLSTHRRVDSLITVTFNDNRPSITRLAVSLDYNFNKDHVDTVDQLRSYYVVRRRGRRTWPALAW